LTVPDAEQLDLEDKMKNNIMFSLTAICFAASFGYAQQALRTDQPVTARQDALDPTPINPAVDHNIDMFINNPLVSKTAFTLSDSAHQL
jgi:hypothetical protein